MAARRQNRVQEGTRLVTGPRQVDEGERLRLQRQIQTRRQTFVEVRDDAKTLFHVDAHRESDGGASTHRRRLLGAR